MLSGGQQHISNGGTAISTLVSSGGQQTINSGAIVRDTQILDGGQQNLLSGAAVSATHLSGATQAVNSGGKATGTHVSSGSLQNLLEGGEAISTTVSSGGQQRVNNGAIATLNSIVAGGQQHISSGGRTVNTQVNGGAQHISSGAVASENTVLNGGQQHISGGTASGTTVASRGQQHISSGGVASDTTVSSGGQQHISSGAAANSANVVGGQQHIYADGSASNTTLSNGGQQYVRRGGTATSTRILNGGQQHLNQGGTALNTEISNGGQQHISSGVTVSGAQLNGGSQFVSQGGTISGTVVNDGGKVYVSTGGASYFTIINNGGHEYIQSGGYGPNATINSGGQQTISSGGVDGGTTINSGGVQHVYGEVKTAQIAGGTQWVYSGGRASGGTMGSNGRIEVNAGGTLLDTVISGGRNVINVRGGSLNGLSISSGGSGNVITVASANLKGNLRDNAGANSLNISGSRFSAANTASSATSASAEVVGISGWKNLSLSDGAGMTLAGDLALSQASQLLINGNAYLNQSVANTTLTASQLINAGAISVLAGQTLNLVGNYTQTSNGILEVGLDGQGGSSKLKVSGNATLDNGARLYIHRSSPSLVSNTRYNNILQGTTLTGNYGGGVYRGHKYKLENNGTGIDLLVLGRVELHSLLGGGQAQASLDQSQANLGLIRERMDRMNGSAYYGTDASNQIWYTPSPYGHTGRRGGSHGAVPSAGYEQVGAGMAFGVDKALSPERRVGAAVIISGNKIEGTTPAFNDNISTTGAELAIYGRDQLQENLAVSLIAKSGYAKARSSRLETSDRPATVKSRQDIWSLNLAAELMYDIVRDNLTISPMVGVEYGHAWVGGYSESGAGYYDLDVKRQRAKSLITSVGSRVRYNLSEDSRIMGMASIGYDALARDSELSATNEDQRFKTISASPGDTVSRLGLAYEWLTPASTLFRVSYDHMSRNKGYKDNMVRVDWIWQY